MKYVLIDKMDGDMFNAGKARDDIAKILTKKNFTPCTFYDRAHSKAGFISDVLKLLIRILFSFNKDMVLIQYPYGLSVMKIVLTALKFKKCHIILLIHDVMYLRGGDVEKQISDEITKKEIALFNMSNIVICHNNAMLYQLKKDGMRSRSINLNVFDYLCSLNEKKKDDKQFDIVFAGNLNMIKSGFVYKLGENQDVHVGLYGVGVDEKKLSHNITYLGSYIADDLPSHLNGKYGLVWDGGDLETCSGQFGNYLHYNCPHKLSLYIAANIPVIVWKESAMARYVEIQNIGIVVDSLETIKEKLDSVSETQYNDMKNNAKVLGEKLRSGKSLLRVLSEIYEANKNEC